MAFLPRIIICLLMCLSAIGWRSAYAYYYTVTGDEPGSFTPSQPVPPGSTSDEAPLYLSSTAASVQLTDNCSFNTLYNDFSTIILYDANTDYTINVEAGCTLTQRTGRGVIYNSESGNTITVNIEGFIFGTANSPANPIIDDVSSSSSATSINYTQSGAGTSNGTFILSSGTSGNFNINSSGNITTTSFGLGNAGINFNSTGIVTGADSGITQITATGSGAIIRVGPTTPSNITINANVTNVPYVSVFDTGGASSLTTNGNYTGVTGYLSTASNGQFILTNSNNVSGSAYLANSGTLSIESGSFALTGSLTNSGTINITSTYLMPSVTTSNTGTINLNGSGIITDPSGGNNPAISGSGSASFNIGPSSACTVNFGSGSSMSIPTVTIANSGSSLTMYGTSSLSTELSIANSTYATFYGNVSGGGNLFNAGTLTIAAGTTFSLSGGASTNTGNIYAYGAFDLPTFTSGGNTGSINLIGSGSALGGNNLVGTTGSSLNIGANSAAATISYGGSITNVPTIVVETSGSSFASSGGISGLSSLSIAAGTSASFTAASTNSVLGTAPLINHGTLTIGSGVTFNLSGALTNTGIVNVAGTYTVPASMPTNTGTWYIYGTAGNLGGTNTFTGDGSLAVLNIGSDSSLNAYPTLSYATTGPITNVPKINVNAGTFTAETAISNVTAFTVSGNANVTFSAGLSGVASSSATNTITIGGVFANAYGGSLSFNSGGSLTNFGQINLDTFGSLTLNNAGTFGSNTAITGAANSSNTALNIENSTAFIANAAIANISNIYITGGTANLELNSTISDVGTITIGSSGDNTYLELNSGASLLDVGDYNH